MLEALADVKPEPAPAKADDAPKIVDYHNGLSDSDRETFYHITEGSAMIPLALLQALERDRTPQDPPGDGRVGFMDNLARYGFIPDRKYDRNPGALPVGMTVERSSLTNRLMVGFNCTACHVGELWREGRRVRVDGAPNMVRLNNLFADAKTEIDATLADLTGRRERFLINLARHRRENDELFPSERTLGDRVRDLATDIDLAQAFVANLKAMPTLKAQTATENGYGRVDAFGVARNLLFGGDPRNLRPQNAPVSFPYMWGLKTTAWLQWGANINSVMERNIGQTLGVGARFDANFATTSRLDNLNVLEKRVYKLTPPEWREDVLGPVDRALADRGKPLYEQAVQQLPRAAVRGVTDRPGHVSVVPFERGRHEPGRRHELRSHGDHTPRASGGSPMRRSKPSRPSSSSTTRPTTSRPRCRPTGKAATCGRCRWQPSAARSLTPTSIPTARAAASIRPSRSPASGQPRRISTTDRSPTCGIC